MSNIPRSASGPDNYFNNSIYKSGWTYHGKTIGSPYFTPKPVDENGITSGVIVGDNRFAAINIGANGFFKSVCLIKVTAKPHHLLRVVWPGV